MTDTVEIEKQIIEIIENSINKRTQHDLESVIAAQYQATPKKIRALIKGLVSTGKLSYTNIHGRTFIEISYSRPVRVTDHIILKPTGVKDMRQGVNDIVIELMFGDAFGTGHHPTTRLALQGIEYLKEKTTVFNNSSEKCALDIGTGSGVLAIGVVKLGFGTAVGIDIDPCACHEAKENIRINSLADKITVFNDSPESFDCQFDVVLANLRFPTIISLCRQLSDCMASNGAIVVSGIKEEEVNNVLKVYGAAGFDLEWMRIEKEWTGLVFMK
ncbi:MAG: 50S ribosomal protein L11 methyltransferase [Desulfobacterales bacterium]|nr:50S ribosomal protein L11 methyltransferase [Desulfobacterales bacterium]